MGKSPANTSDKLLAFLDIATFEDGAALRGGCLITDVNTHPLEFHVTGVIRPTNLQKILYGDTMHEYICNDIIGLPILNAIQSKPDLILVRDSEFLKLRPNIEIPVLWVRATVDGQYVLQALPGHDQEAEIGRDVLPKRLRGRSIMEPFLRIRAGLEEAHTLKTAEKKKT